MILSNPFWLAILDHVQRSTDNLLGIAEGHTQDAIDCVEPLNGNGRTDSAGGYDQRDILIHPKEEMRVCEDV